MKYFSQHSLEQVALEMRFRSLSGTWDGREQTPYLNRCRGMHGPTGTVLIFTRDSGHHSSGWWKNPEFERAKHLSISFRDPLTGLPRDFDMTLAERWVRHFFTETERKCLWMDGL